MDTPKSKEGFELSVSLPWKWANQTKDTAYVRAGMEIANHASKYNELSAPARNALFFNIKHAGFEMTTLQLIVTTSTKETARELAQFFLSEMYAISLSIEDVSG